MFNVTVSESAMIYTTPLYMAIDQVLIRTVDDVYSFNTQDPCVALSIRLHRLAAKTTCIDVLIFMDS